MPHGSSAHAWPVTEVHQPAHGLSQGSPARAWPVTGFASLLYCYVPFACQLKRPRPRPVLLVFLVKQMRLNLHIGYVSNLLNTLLLISLKCAHDDGSRW
jgi:hypothetical protein